MRGLFTRNLKLKGMALAFSVALWFFVAGQRDTEMAFMVPLGYKGIPKDMVVTSSPYKEVEIRVSGPKLIISNLSPSQIIASLDLSGAVEGTKTYRLRPVDVELPVGVDATRIRPSSFTVKMARIVSVEVPVKPVIKGRPARGFRLTETVVVPEKVTVSGLAGDVRDLKSVATTPVDITGISESKAYEAGLDLLDKEFRKVAADGVTVKVNVEKELEEK